MTHKAFGYKFASLVNSQDEHHLKISAPGEQGLNDRHIILVSFVKGIGLLGLSPRFSL